MVAELPNPHGPPTLRIADPLSTRLVVEALVGHEGHQPSEARGGCPSIRWMAGVAVVEEENIGQKGQMLINLRRRMCCSLRLEM